MGLSWCGDTASWCVGSSITSIFFPSAPPFDVMCPMLTGCCTLVTKRAHLSPLAAPSWPCLAEIVAAEIDRTGRWREILHIWQTSRWLPWIADPDLYRLRRCCPLVPVSDTHRVSTPQCVVINQAMTCWLNVQLVCANSCIKDQLVGYQKIQLVDG